MSMNSVPPETDVTVTTAEVGLGSDAMARRRLLLKSLGKGTALATAVAVPLKTLAAPAVIFYDDGKGSKLRRCTISGSMSGVHSKETSQDFCEGTKSSAYANKAYWPGYNATDKTISFKVGSNTFSEKSTFISVFGSGSPSKLIDLVTNSSTSPEAHWVTALLNSLQTNATRAKLFPYSPTKVVQLYNGIGGQPTDALNFFSKFMETLS